MASRSSPTGAFKIVSCSSALICPATRRRNSSVIAFRSWSVSLEFLSVSARVISSLRFSNCGSCATRSVSAFFAAAARSSTAVLNRSAVVGTFLSAGVGVYF